MATIRSASDRYPRSAAEASRQEAAERAPDPSRRWPLERVLFLLAGTMTLISALLAAVVSPWFLLLTAFVGANQLAFVAFGNCPTSWVLQRYLGFDRGCPR